MREYQEIIEEKMAFFRDLDITKVRQAQENYERLQKENTKIEANMKKSDKERIKLIKENTKLSLFQDQYKSAINTTLDFNNSILSSLSKIRAEITCEEVSDENKLLDEVIFRIKSTPADATIKGPISGTKQVTNTFKSHMSTQRSTINDQIDVLMKVIKIAYSLNRPLLASKQALEEVFRSQKKDIKAE